MRMTTSAALLLPLIAACGRASSSAPPSVPQPIEVGSPAPDFSAPAHDGTTVKLSALRGRPVVLYFYPKDATPG